MTPLISRVPTGRTGLEDSFYKGDILGRSALYGGAPGPGNTPLYTPSLTAATIADAVTTEKSVPTPDATPPALTIANATFQEAREGGGGFAETTAYPVVSPTDVEVSTYPASIAEQRIESGFRNLILARQELPRTRWEAA